MHITVETLLESLLLAIKMCTGFSTDVTWVNTKVYSYTQLFSGADESLKDKTHLLLL